MDPGARYVNVDSVLATRETAEMVVRTSRGLTSTESADVTAFSGVQPLRLGLDEDPETLAGLWFTITRSGIFPVVIASALGDLNVTLAADGDHVTVCCDGVNWFVTAAGTTDTESIPPAAVAELRIFDTATCKMRQALSLSEALDSAYQLVALCVETMRDAGIEQPPELEEFHELVRR